MQIDRSTSYEAAKKQDTVTASVKTCILSGEYLRYVLSLLTSRWSLTRHTGPGVAHSSREHDSSLRQGQGGLVDQHGTLQSGENQERSHGQWGLGVRGGVVGGVR